VESSCESDNKPSGSINLMATQLVASLSVLSSKGLVIDCNWFPEECKQRNLIWTPTTINKLEKTNALLLHLVQNKSYVPMSHRLTFHYSVNPTDSKHKGIFRCSTGSLT
jgi:hypothetical protein